MGAAARGGKAAMAKLENKVHELEAELAGTQDRTGEAAKAYQRAERKCKELAFSAGEDKKNQDRMTDLASKLQSKIKVYKQQIEEAEEIAALNLAKFRKAQQELEEVEERAKLAALLLISGNRPSHRIDQLNLEKNLDRSANPLKPNNLVGTKVANQRNPELPLTSPTSPLEELFGPSLMCAGMN